MPEENRTDKKIKLLLLTNRDSDNIGDQFIEACDISLIKTVMRNLGIPEDGYNIHSRAAAIVSQKYIQTKDASLLESAENSVIESDLIIFGGAPLFNYKYQNFYERTAVTLELAEKHQTPVIFSAIGIESYDEDDARCQRLKKTLNFNCVKQITTRDGLEHLERYKENPNLMIGKVSDPAVFAAKVFEKYRPKKKEQEGGEQAKKKIGLFILRANGFKDNGYNLTRQGSAKLWEDVTKLLEEKGYEYTLLSSGHFGDEAFIDYLIRNNNIDTRKCAFNMNYPERLVQRIDSFDGIVSCRLHPSIISFSMGVPTVGLIWNPKVKAFYESVGYEDRLVDAEGITAEQIVEKLEHAMEEGVAKDEDYLVTVYRSMFAGIKAALCPDSEAEPYSYEEMLKALVPYPGTTEKDKQEKLRIKFRRTYHKYNDVSALLVDARESNRINRKKLKENEETIRNLKKQVEEQKKEIDKLKSAWYRKLYRLLRRCYHKLFRRK